MRITSANPKTLPIFVPIDDVIPYLYKCLELLRFFLYYVLRIGEQLVGVEHDKPPSRDAFQVFRADASQRWQRGLKVAQWNPAYSMNGVGQNADFHAAFANYDDAVSDRSKRYKGDRKTSSDQPPAAPGHAR